MKNNSKSGLCMLQIITTVIAVVVISFSIGLVNYKNNNIEVASLEKNTLENVQDEVQVAQTNERDVQTISRSSEERIITKELEQEETIIEEVVEENKQNYISIEEITISRNMDLTKRCGVSKEDFKILMTNLKTDTSGFFETNSDLIYDLCEKYELNEIFFCGLIAGESGWKIASNHRNANNYISMMSGGKLIRYSSVEEGLEAAAKLLHNKYLTEGGSCYYGKTLSCVQRRFCPNSSTWVGLIYGCMSQVIK